LQEKNVVILFRQRIRSIRVQNPHSVICREDIDFDNPDFDKWPALKHINPMVADLKHGEMLYMPEGWWHYMKYLTPGFSMSLRLLAHKPKNFI
jgi:hypothetical protein